MSHFQIESAHNKEASGAENCSPRRSHGGAPYRKTQAVAQANFLTHSEALKNIDTKQLRTEKYEVFCAPKLNNHKIVIDNKIFSSVSLRPRQRPTIILMRGLSGSGKSTLARKLAADKNGVVISADDYFTTKEGAYLYDRRRIRCAHQDAQKRIDSALSKGAKYIVIDNTHITHRDMDEYLKIAAHHDALVELVQPQTPWAWNTNECARRNVHGVSADVIRSMNDRYQHMETSEAQSIVSSLRGFMMGQDQ